MTHNKFSQEYKIILDTEISDEETGTNGINKYVLENESVCAVAGMPSFVEKQNRSEKELYFSNPMVDFIMQMCQKNIVRALNFVTILRLIIITNSNRIAIPSIDGFSVNGEYKEVIAIRGEEGRKTFFNRNVVILASKEEKETYRDVKDINKIYVLKNAESDIDLLERVVARKALNILQVNCDQSSRLLTKLGNEYRSFSELYVYMLALYAKAYEEKYLGSHTEMDKLIEEVAEFWMQSKKLPHMLDMRKLMQRKDEYKISNELLIKSDVEREVRRIESRGIALRLKKIKRLFRRKSG